MKKCLLLIASILFLWVFSFAQSPPGATGVVSVQVVKHLELTIDEPNLKFVYNEAHPGGHPPTDEYNSSEIRVKTNVNWALSVCTLNGATVLTHTTRPSETIDANQFKYYAMGSGITSGSSLQELGPTCINPIKGNINNNLVFTLYWEVDPSFTENLYAGAYVVGITYKLSEQ